MWFLLLEIFLLLALAAVFGALLAHWWFKRHYEDVTISHNANASKSDIALQGLLTKFDFETSMAKLNAPDLSPMEHRLNQMEDAISAITIPETDLSPVQHRLNAMEQAIANIKIPEIPQTDFSPLEERLFSMESMLSAPTPDNNDDTSERLSVIEDKLAAIATRTADLRNTDTARLERQMDVMANAIAEHGEVDMTTFEARLHGLEDAITALHMPEIDLGPIHSGLTRVEMSLANLDMPEIDLSAVESRVHAMHESVTEHRALDLNEKDELHKRLINLSTAVSALRSTDFSPLDRRLDDIETRIAHINIPEPDLSTVDDSLSMLHTRMTALEARLDESAKKQVDFNPINQRLDQIHAEAQRLEYIQAEISRLDRMEGKMSSLRTDITDAVPNLEPLEQRLTALQSEIANQPAPDLAPIISSVYAMEQRMDFGAMENRLTSIEYGLAALHHMLRSRQAQEASYRTPAPAERPQTPPPPPAFTQHKPEPTYYRAPQPTQTYTPPPPRDPWPDELPVTRPFDVPDTPNTSGYEYQTAPMPERKSRLKPRPEPTRAPIAPRDLFNEARRPNDKANLLMRPAFGAPDDLEEISGVGPMLHGLLTEIGVFYFWQVAEWGPREIEWVDDMLDGFNGRIERDDWVGQARILANGQGAAKRP